MDNLRIHDPFDETESLEASGIGTVTSPCLTNEDFLLVGFGGVN